MAPRELGYRPGSRQLWLAVATMLLAVGCWVGCGRRTLSDARDGGAGALDPSGSRDGGPGLPTADAAATDLGPVVVAPEVSRAWTWRSCGEMTPSAVDVAARFGPDGTIAVLSERGIRLHDQTGSFPPLSGGPADFLISAPDGAVLAGTMTSAAIVMTPFDGTTPRFTFNLPPTAACGKLVAFSVNGKYLLARGGGVSCVWRTSDQGFVASLPTSGEEVAVRGDGIVSIEETSQRSYAVTRDLTGKETARVQIDAVGGALLSPAGDRALTLWSGPPALWDLDSGRRVTWTPVGPSARSPTFSPKGDLVLLGDGIFRTADGVRVETIDPSSRAATAFGEVLALSADGKRMVRNEFGRATLEAISSPGIVAVLGGLPLPQPGETAKSINKLALSADGAVLVSNILNRAGFGFRLAASFRDSRLIWSMSSEVNVDVDVSTDGEMAAIGGDGRGLYSAVDGRILWPPPTPPPSLLACATEGLHFSPKRTWAAGSSYERTVDVFALRGAPGTASREPILRLPAACGDAATFSRDERLMATSTPALYRTAATAAGWQRVWSAPISSLPSSGFDFAGWANDVRFSPDETQLLVSRCDQSAVCVARLVSVATGEVSQTLPALQSAHPSFSPEGSWIVAGGTLLHLPSGDVRTFDPAVTTTTALFTPDGDIIAASGDGVLTRYCRSN
jgi:WD40 repeat protein